jgi:hypothetical protein
MNRQIDESSLHEGIKKGKAPNKKWEKGEAFLEFNINDEIYHINIYDELIIDAENTKRMNEIAALSCADGAFWCGISRKVKSKLDTFEQIELKKWNAHVYKYAKYMCLGEKSKTTAADIETKIINAFSEDLISEDKTDIKSLKKNVKFFVESAIKGMFLERDFSVLPIKETEFDQYFGMMYADVYDIREVNFEIIKRGMIKLEEINDILDWIKKIMAEKRITLISTISNNLRSEQNLYGRESTEAIKNFNKSVLEDPEFKEMLKKIIEKQ